jgi:hypothetical protein
MSESQLMLARSEIIRWWESRRLRYNIFVGLMGITTWFLVWIAGSAAVKPGVDFEEPFAMILGPFVYGALANLCYTLGWVVDTRYYRGRPRVKLYRLGVAFSLLLTALPGAWAVYCWIHSVVTGQKMD